MEKILTQEYFSGKNTVKIAKNLLGKFLVRKYRGKIIAYMIIEVEAYDGFKDMASHAHHGKTERNKIMFGSAGHWYIYFTYGMHYMLNIVTGPKDYPAAILIRSIKIARPELSQKTANIVINGPARLTKALHIDKKINGSIADKKSGLWLEDGGFKINKHQIKSSARIGVDCAGPVWSKKKYRFYFN